MNIKAQVNHKVDFGIREPNFKFVYFFSLYNIAKCQQRTKWGLPFFIPYYQKAYIKYMLMQLPTYYLCIWLVYLLWHCPNYSCKAMSNIDQMVILTSV